MGTTASKTTKHSDDISTDDMAGLPKSIPVKPTPPDPFSTNARAGPGPSTLARGSSAKGKPVLVDTKDKEEGEISDGDDEDDSMTDRHRPPSPRRRPQTPPRRGTQVNSLPVESVPYRRSEFTSRLSRSPHALPPRPPGVATPPLQQPIPLPSTRDIAVEVTVQPGPNEPAAESTYSASIEDLLRPMTPRSLNVALEEIEIIRNLLQESIPPHELIDGGANALYVKAICGELVARRRTAVPSSSGNPTPPRVQTPPIPSQIPAPPHPGPSRLGSKPSLGSEASEERLVESMMGLASPKTAPVRMVKSSSWHPPTPPPPPPPPLDDYPPPPPSPRRIEAYRPPTPPGLPPPNAPTSLSSNGSMSSTTLTATMRNLHSTSSYPGSLSPALPRDNPYILPPAPGMASSPHHQPNPYLPPPPLSTASFSSPMREPNPYLPLPTPPQNHYTPPLPVSQPIPYPSYPPPQLPQNPYLIKQSSPLPPNPYLATPPLARPSLPPKPAPVTLVYNGVVSRNPFPNGNPLRPEPIVYTPSPPPGFYPFVGQPAPESAPAALVYNGVVSRNPLPNGNPLRPEANEYTPIPPPALSPFVDQPASDAIPSPRLLEVELAARTALLETRRKAFESMKRRREANRPAASTPDPLPAEAAPVIDLTLDDDVSIIVDEEDEEDVVAQPGEQTIEEQMAQLEQEVMGLQTEQAAAAVEALQEDVDMDMESAEDGEIEAEEGEIEDDATPIQGTTPVLSVPALAPSTTTTPAVRIPRGTKRANAEDMMDSNRPTTLPARMPPNKRRSLFGGMPQRPNRLIMLLDHSDSEDDDDDHDDFDKADRMSKLKITSGNVTPVSETAKLLAEKEEGIRKLREQIEKRMKAKVAKMAKKKPGQTQQAVKEIAGAAKDVLEVEMMDAVVKEEAKEGIAEPVEQESGTRQAEAMVRPFEDVEMAESSAPTTEVAKAADLPAPQLENPAPVVVDDLPKVETPEVVRPALTLSEPESTSAAQPTSTPYYRLYSPILPRYPQLRISVPMLHFRPETSVSAPSLDIDQTLLSSIILTRRLETEPGATLCAAETAGGSCADATCGDIHLVKGSHNDGDLAEYLSHVYPGSSTADILDKLGQARSASACDSTRTTAQTAPRKGRIGKGGLGGGATSATSGTSGTQADTQGLLARVGQLLAGE